MITKQIIGHCANCNASYRVESDSETWETRGEWINGDPNCLHEMNGFGDDEIRIKPSQNLHPVFQTTIDNFKKSNGVT